MREFSELPLHSDWVGRSLNKMSLDQMIGQLLHPCVHPSASEEERIDALGGVEPGGVFLFSGSRQQFQQTTGWFQEHSRLPIIVSSDLEHGAGRMILDATVFPGTMALAATDSEELAYEMGRAAAVEGRAFGVHWAFAPVVDVNINPFNPGTNTISLGDDPERISRLANAVIRGLQEQGVSATAKHFPGGGVDDRDQHICNTINPLQMDQWLAVSGHTFQRSIDLGVWSIMIGHVSLPAWDPGDGTHMQNAPPATLSRRMLFDLLRGKMGFEGVIITDAMDMGGVMAFGPQEEIVPAAIEAGCDMILFSDVKRDFPALKQALADGRLSEARIEESARRILALKEALRLHETTDSPALAQEDRAHFQRISQTIAEEAVTLVRDQQRILPLQLKAGQRVLSYHLRGDREDHVDAFDEMLRQRGVEVTRYDETDVGKLHKTDDFEHYNAIILSAVIGASWGTNRIRPAGNYMRDVWALINSHHPRLVLVSYGSPYILYDMPHTPCVINAYSPDLNMQTAVLRVLTGELSPTATSPVNLEAPYQLKHLEGLRYAHSQTPSASVSRLLVADVGATKTDLAIYSSDLGPEQALASSTEPTAKYGTLEELVAGFLQGAHHSVDGAVLAVAGPVVDGHVTATSSHLRWALDERELQQSLGLESLRLINDLEASATAIPRLTAGHLHTLHAGRPEPNGTLAVVAPGTGLGEAFLLWDGQQYRTCISEGGHAAFASTTPFEAELLRHVQASVGYASYESVCSGLGLPNIYACLKSGDYAREPAWLQEQLADAEDPTPIIVRAALGRDEPCELCRLAVQTFIAILGSEAGNLALKVYATGGVFLGGGMPLRILPLLQQERSAFLHSFCNRGMMTEVMKRIPVQVVTHPQVTLMGAYWWACGSTCANGDPSPPPK